VAANFSFRFVLAALLCAFFTAARAQTPDGQAVWTVTADQLVQMALTNNLDILISEINPEVDQFNLSGLYGAYEPDFTMNATHNYDSFPSGVFTQAGLTYPARVESINSYTPGLSGTLPSGLTYTLTGPLAQQNVTDSPELYNSQPGITLNQPILKNLWIDNNRYQILVSKKTLKIDQLALGLQIITVINTVKAAYYNLIYDRENVAVEQAAVGLAEETHREDVERVRVGALAPLDEKQAESQAASAESDLLTAQAALAVQENTIKTLLGVSARDWETMVPVPTEQLVAVPENPQVQECWRLGMERRPDMLQAKANLEKQHITLKYDFNQLFPEIDLTGSYGRNATELTFDDNLNTIRQGTYPFYSYGVVLTIPLGNSGPRNRYKADKATLRQLVLQAKKTEDSIVTAIDSDIQNIRSDLPKVDSTRQARLYAEEALQAEQTKLLHGGSTSFIVLQLENDLTTARSAEIRALADYNIALEQLAFDDGTTLERNHITLRLR
jgi:outer membrane protein TolC